MVAEQGYRLHAVSGWILESYTDSHHLRMELVLGQLAGAWGFWVES